MLMLSGPKDLLVLLLIMAVVTSSTDMVTLGLGRLRVALSIFRFTVRVVCRVVVVNCLLNADAMDELVVCVLSLKLMVVF